MAEVKILGMIADVALQNEDFDEAYKMAVGVCWVACYQLGRQPEFEYV